MGKVVIKRIEVDEQSLMDVMRFLQEVFPKNKKFTFDFIKWQYADNPLGAMVGFNAWENDKIVSHFAGLPLEMELYGKKRKGLLCINVGTKEAFRGQKLFTILGNKTTELAKESGFDFMIAVPNANSSHGFLKYFGYYLVSPLMVKLGLGTNIYDSRRFSCFRVWNGEQFKWRLSNPTNKYFCKCQERGTLSTPIAFFFKTVSRLRLSEDLSSFFFKNTSWRPFNLYIGLGANTNRGFYIDMPSFIKRPPFNVVFKDLTEGEIPKVTKENLFLQLIDLDTI